MTINVFSEIISKIIVMALIYLIINKAFNNFRYRTKYLILFIIGAIISGAFYLALVLDKGNHQQSIYSYYTFIVVNAVVALHSLYKLIFKFRKNEFQKYSYNNTKKVERTSKALYKEFLYLLFEYKGEYLLKKTKQTYSGMKISLKRAYFHDEAISKVLSKYHCESKEVTMYGEYTDTKNKEIYYVYLISLTNDINPKKYEWFHFSKIRFLDLTDFDKEIIYRVLLKEKFEIKR